MIVKNHDIVSLSLGVPEGHRHLRAVFELRDGKELVFSEATIANLVRAYVTLKTHPCRREVCLVGRELAERKEGFAAWQLLEAEQS